MRRRTERTSSVDFHWRLWLDRSDDVPPICVLVEVDALNHIFCWALSMPSRIFRRMLCHGSIVTTAPLNTLGQCLHVSSCFSSVHIYYALSVKFWKCFQETQVPPYMTISIFMTGTSNQKEPLVSVVQRSTFNCHADHQRSSAQRRSAPWEVTRHRGKMGIPGSD